MQYESTSQSEMDNIQNNWNQNASDVHQFDDADFEETRRQMKVKNTRLQPDVKRSSNQSM